MLPPIVPRFRTAGSPTRAAASASAGRRSPYVGRCGQFRVRRERADSQRSVADGDAPQLRDAADVDDRGRHGEPELQQRNQAVTAGEQLRARIRRHQLLRLRERTGPVIVEVCGIHRQAPFCRCIARHTRSGVIGI